MLNEQKKQIDEISYDEMLELWRFAPTGHSMFQGEIGEYFKTKMGEKSKKISNEERVNVSKKIGW